MKRIVKVLKGGHYAHKFSDAERAGLEKKHKGLKFVADGSEIHLMEFAEGVDSSLVISAITRALNIPFDGGFQTKYGHSSAPGQRFEPDHSTTFSSRAAGIGVVHDVPSPYAT